MIFGLIITLIMVFAFYSAGSFLIWISKSKTDDEQFQGIFLRLTIGVLFLAFLYSVYKTKGNTIHVLLPIIGLVYLFNRDTQKNNVPHKFSSCFYFSQGLIKLFLLLAVLSSVIYGYYASLYFNTPFNNILHFDEVYYSMCSSKIGQFGVESVEALYSWKDTNAADPYHYIELWLTHFIASSFSINPLYALSVIFKSVVTVNLVIGFFALTRLFTSSRVMLFFSFFAMFTAPILLDYSNIRQGACIAHQIKTLLGSSLLIWFVIETIKKSKHWFFPLLCSLAVNISFVPIIVPSIGIFSILGWIKNKSYSKTLAVLVPTMIATLFVALFYFLQPSGHTSVNESVIKDISSYYNFSIFFNMLYRSFVNYVMYLPYFIPLFILIVWQFISDSNKLFNELRKYASLILYLIISAIVGFFLTFTMFPFVGVNSTAFNGHGTMMLLNIVVYLSYLIVFNSLQKGAKRYTIALFIFLLLSATYNASVFHITRINMIINPVNLRSFEYISNITKYHEKHGYGFKGGYLLSIEEFFIKGEPGNKGEAVKAGSRGEGMNGYYFTPYCTANDFFYFTSLQTTIDPYKNFDFTKLDLRVQDELEAYWYYHYFTKKALQNAPFTVFAKEYESTHGATSIDILQSEFIKMDGIEFLTVSAKTELPQILNNLVDTTFVDSQTGEKFIFLKKAI